MNLFCRKAFGILAGASVLLGALAAAEPAQGTGAEWKVAFASVKITPEQPVSLAGYSGRTGPFEKVESDLYAKALCLEDSKSQVGVLVTTDLIGLGADLCENVCSRVAQSTGLKREQILLNASHTHTGPSLSLGRGGARPDGANKFQGNVDYTLKLQDKLVDLIVTAVPAFLGTGRGQFRLEPPGMD
jgi:neutral ceramidase